MQKNYYHDVEVELVNTNLIPQSYAKDFPVWQNLYNNHTVKDNPKEIDTITTTPNNTIKIGFWSEEPLPCGREVQSLRRLSEAMASSYPFFVVGKSHVLQSV